MPTNEIIVLIRWSDCNKNFICRRSAVIHIFIWFHFKIELSSLTPYIDFSAEATKVFFVGEMYWSPFSPFPCHLSSSLIFILCTNGPVVRSAACTEIHLNKIWFNMKTYFHPQCETVNLIVTYESQKNSVNIYYVAE